MEEIKNVVLTDQREIVLEDEDDILLSVLADDNTKHTFSVPYPSAGYGGGSLLLSPSEQYLLFSYFSGQSQEAFCLFKIGNGQLELCYESGYMYGEDANYCFSSDEKHLLQTLRTGWWYAEMDEADENGDNFYEFGQINILNMDKKTFERHLIHVFPSDDWQEEITDHGPFLFDKMINDTLLSVILPWGQATFHVPLQDVLVIRSE